MIDPVQFRREVIEPVLTRLGGGYDTPEAADLLIGTALAESDLIYIRQFAAGPALGLYQMEPSTARDIYDSWLDYRPALRGSVQSFRAIALPIEADLIANMAYATAMARVHYARVPAPIPTSIPAQAQYWKDHYNTALGAGTVEHYLSHEHVIERSRWRRHET